MTPARRRLAVLVLTGSLALVAPACSDDGDSEAFCDRITSMPDVEEILSSLDASDPGGIERAVEEALAEFQALEADAPGDIRPHLARLRQGVALILEAVQDNPGDLPAARADILDHSDELTGLASAGTRVADYAQTECSVTLGDEQDDPEVEPAPPTDAQDDGTASTTGG